MPASGSIKYSLIVTSMSDRVPKVINKFYVSENSTFGSRYSLDILVALIIAGVFTVATGYFEIMGQRAKYKANWSKHRCDPAIMPFAGMLNAPKGTDWSTYTADNFATCVGTIFTAAEDVIQSGADAVAAGLVDVIALAGVAISDLASVISKFRALLADLLALLGGSSASTGGGMQGMSNLMGMLGKIFKGTMQVFSQTGHASGSGLGATANYAFKQAELKVWKIMGVANSLLVPAWWFPFIAILVIAFDVLGLLIEGIIEGIKLIFDTGLGMFEAIEGPAISVFCFAPDTPVTLRSGLAIPMRLCKPGMMTAEGGMITAVQHLRRPRGGPQMYRLRGVLVTGDHQMYDVEGNMSPVSSHREAVRASAETDALCCITTTTGRIKINGIAYADWDEFDQEDLHALGVTHGTKHVLRTGLAPDGLVRRRGGVHVPVHSLVPGDLLDESIEVIGVVEMMGGKRHIITSTGDIPVENGSVKDYRQEGDCGLEE